MYANMPKITFDFTIKKILLEKMKKIGFCQHCIDRLTRPNCTKFLFTHNSC